MAGSANIPTQATAVQIKVFYTQVKSNDHGQRDEVFAFASLKSDDIGVIKALNDVAVTHEHHPLDYGQSWPQFKLQQRLSHL